MTKTMDLTALRSQIRRDILRMVHGAQSGHPGGSLGCVEYFVALYHEVMTLREGFESRGSGEDLFFLSNGHISPVWYSTLARRGYFSPQELSTFRKLNSRLQGHPTTAEHLEGVRVASGSLGQGLSVACGAAISLRSRGEDYSVYVLMGDGELQEGQIWEAAMFAAHHKLTNLIATVDCNGLQIDGSVDEVISLGSLRDKWESFGWRVMEADGNNYDEIKGTLLEAKHNRDTAKPTVILMKTVMGKGVDFMENNHKWHGSPPNDEQLEAALAQLPSSIGDY